MEPSAKTSNGKTSNGDYLDTYRTGYPKYAALLSAHPSFYNFRRFTRVRMRLLLQKQDEITQLEDELDDIDEEESRPLFLGTLRQDMNPERQRVLRSLGTALHEYGEALGNFEKEDTWLMSSPDDMIERSRRTLSLPPATRRDIDNLTAWTEATGCISRRETEYLDKEQDLANLTGSSDTAITYCHSLVEDCVGWLDDNLGHYFPNARNRRHKITPDDSVLILGPKLKYFSRMLATIFATLIILIPTVILPTMSSMVGQVLAGSLSCCLFILIVSVFTGARTGEIFAAGASYAAVIVAFTTGNPANNFK